MAETDVQLVLTSSNLIDDDRMNEFYGIHCYYRYRRSKVADLSRGSHGEVVDDVAVFPVSWRGDVTGLSRTCRGRDGDVGIMEFGL